MQRQINHLKNLTAILALYKGNQTQFLLVKLWRNVELNTCANRPAFNLLLVPFPDDVIMPQNIPFFLSPVTLIFANFRGLVTNRKFM